MFRVEGEKTIKLFYYLEIKRKKLAKMPNTTNIKQGGNRFKTLTLAEICFFSVDANVAQ